MNPLQLKNESLDKLINDVEELLGRRCRVIGSSHPPGAGR